MMSWQCSEWKVHSGFIIRNSKSEASDRRNPPEAGDMEIVWPFDYWVSHMTQLVLDILHQQYEPPHLL